MRPALDFAENARVTVRFSFAFSGTDDGVSERVKAEPPVTVRFIVPEKPLMLVNVTVELPAAPWVRLNEALEIWIVNPETVMLRSTERTRVLFVPVTVTPYTFGAADWDAEIVTEAYAV